MVGSLLRGDNHARAEDAAQGRRRPLAEADDEPLSALTGLHGGTGATTEGEKVTECSAKVNRGDSRWPNSQPCGREAVEDGLCKLHFRVRTRREAKHLAWQEKHARGGRHTGCKSRYNCVLTSFS